MTNKTQQESEAFVKTYQLDPIAGAVTRIESKMDKLITDDALKLSLQPIVSDIANLKKDGENRKWFNRVVIAAVIVLLANLFYEVLVNNGRVQ